MIFNLCLGQCRLILYAPVDGPRAFVDVTALDEATKQASSFRLVMVRHRQVGIVPLAQKAKPLKVARLTFQSLRGVLTASAADRYRRHVGFLSAKLPVDI